MRGNKVAEMSESEWRRVVEGRKSSGLTVKKYCEQVGVGEPAFYAWRRRIEGSRESVARKEEKPGVFHELALPTVISPPADSPSWAVELVLSSGVTIRVRG